MDKNAIKKYAVWARRELIERVSQRAMIYGITAKDAGDPNAESVNGHLLSQKEKRQRQALIRNIKEKGYEQVMEEVAYTWFNRFAALRFMEVNGYLPSHIRVFTNDAGEFKPQILAEAIHLELDGLDMNKVYELESANKSEELFKYLLIVQCNALNSILPGMFQRIDDYTELLLPDYLLREGSVIEQMVTTIPEEDWTDQVQIIGWLYQFYNIDPKAKAISKQRGLKISKDELPAATQLFTPDWIVHYMVENSLGRLWLEGHPNDALKSEWKYYLNEAEQEPDVQNQLATLRKEYAALKPEQIRVIDPCMGSGHILCVLFDVLVRIYEDYGYTAREAAAKIVENNLWGLDIDERAAQLSYFAVMMKARQYDRRFFTRKVQPHVHAISESDGISIAKIDLLERGATSDNERIIRNQLSKLIEEMQNAKEYGSLILPSAYDWETLDRILTDREKQGQLQLDFNAEQATVEVLRKVVDIARILSEQYDVVVTNPPYLAVSDFSAKLSNFTKKHFPDGKADLFAAFIERCNRMTTRHGYYAMITMHSWMFLSSFEELRIKMETADFVNMAHLGARAFEEIGGEVVQTTAFVIRKTSIPKYKSTYCRLLEENSQDEKESAFLQGKERYITSQTKFSKIPGAPVAYWIQPGILDAFENGKQLGSIGEIVTGMSTGNNDSYLRLWAEVSLDSIAFYRSSMEDIDLSITRWIPYNKGGEARKWYGNNDYIVKWSESAHFHRARPTFSHLYLKQGITWSFVTSGMFSARYYPDGFLWDVAGCPFVIFDQRRLYYVLGYLSTTIANTILKIINPTINCQVVDVQRTPIIIDEQRLDEVGVLSRDCISISKDDWDSFESSWDFREHPFVTEARLACHDNRTITVKQAYENWNSAAGRRFERLKANEEALNRIFIDIFNLGEEISPEVEDDKVTVRRANVQRDVRSFISYAVGCMFGRYALGNPGIAYAGGLWDGTKYTQFLPDKDAIIPICDDEYFEDDIVGRFVKFVEVVFGKEALEENLQFIANSLGEKGSSREVIRNYFINDFYTDHLKIYQKRPIYWLFDSGKKNGFKCLIYMHRYQPDTIARIRTDYVHEQQSRYRTASADLEQRINSASTSERVKLSKQLATLQAQAEEILVYEEKIHHLADQMIKIDLDDGVKHNYEIFKDVLAKIK